MSEPSPADKRAERLAAQLRANLRRRKAQARGTGRNDPEAPELTADLSKEDDER